MNQLEKNTVQVFGIEEDNKFGIFKKDSINNSKAEAERREKKRNIRVTASL